MIFYCRQCQNFIEFRKYTHIETKSPACPKCFFPNLIKIFIDEYHQNFINHSNINSNNVSNTFKNNGTNNDKNVVFEKIFYSDGSITVIKHTHTKY